MEKATPNPIRPSPRLPSFRKTSILDSIFPMFRPLGSEAQHQIHSADYPAVLINIREWIPAFRKPLRKASSGADELTAASLPTVNIQWLKTASWSPRKCASPTGICARKRSREIGTANRNSSLASSVVGLTNSL
jgi:hypothetical protein